MTRRHPERRGAKRRGVEGSRSLPSTEHLHAKASSLDGVSTRQFVEAMHREDLVAVRAVGRLSKQIAAVADAVAESLRAGGRLVYVGAGTSGRLGALDAAECPPTFGTKPSQVVAVIAGGARALQRAVEGAEDDRSAGAAQMRRLKVGERDVVCGISASGTAPFVLAALEAARVAGATTVLLSCNPTTAKVHHRLVARTGPEIVAGSTRLKAGTATKLVLNAITTAAMRALGKVRGGQMVALRGTNQKLKARAIRIVARRHRVSATLARRMLEAADWSVAAARPVSD